MGMVGILGIDLCNWGMCCALCTLMSTYVYTVYCVPPYPLKYTMYAMMYSMLYKKNFLFPNFDFLKNLKIRNSKNENFKNF